MGHSRLWSKTVGEKVSFEAGIEHYKPAAPALFADVAVKLLRTSAILIERKIPALDRRKDRQTDRQTDGQNL